MPRPLVKLPDSEALGRLLNTAGNGGRPSGDELTIVDRQPNPRTSTHTSEVLVCRRQRDGGEIRILCKYAAGRDHKAFGHRGGVAYEGEIYRDILARTPLDTAEFHGLLQEPTTGITCLFLGYLDGTVRVRDSTDVGLMTVAARWLAEFHRACEHDRSLVELPFIRRHDRSYFVGWAERTSLLADDLHARFPWLSSLCRRFEDFVDVLLEPPTLIVHGEYYTNNLLSREGRVYPVDWESAAVSLPEIDVASLIEGWPEEVTTACKSEYVAVRWPEGPPVGFQARVEAASLYWDLRWLGERRDWTHQDKALQRFARLKVLGERYGLI